MATPNALVVLPSPGSLPSQAQETVLTVGRTFVARVTATNDEGMLFLRVGHGLIAAQSDQQLPIGSQLRLQVQEVGDQVVLKLLPPAEEEPATPATTAEPEPATSAPTASPTIELPLASLLEAVSTASPTAAAAQAQVAAIVEDETAAPAPTTADTEGQVQEASPQPPAPAGPTVATPEQAPEAVTAQTSLTPPTSSAPTVVAAPVSSTSSAVALPSTTVAPASSAASEDEAISTPVAATVVAEADQSVLAAGSKLSARVISNTPAGVEVKLTGGGRLTLPAQTALAPAGAAVEVEVMQVQGEQARVRLVLPQPAPSADQADERGQLVQTLTEQLTPQLGEQAAAGVAEFIAARAVPSGDTAMLTAQVLTGKESPTTLLRQIAATDPAAAALLDGIENAAVSGDGSELKGALSKIGLDREKQLVLGTLNGDTVKSTGKAAEQVVTSQQVLLTKPSTDTAAPLFLFIPLPNGGQARLLVDDETGQSNKKSGGYSIRGELDLAHIGSLGFHVLSGETGAFLMVESDSPTAAAHLQQGLPQLQETLEKVLKRPVVATVVAPPPGAPRVTTTLDFGKPDVYA